ncbi:MAG: hypothetical protein HC896_16355 [Bacteroidales bacterium]|nr:hypothetical protein [Bacteroidales bacterium]
MVDSIKNVPVYKTFEDVINLLINSYYVHGYFEYGPYYSVYSYNGLDGHKFRVGGRTSNKFSTKTMLYGHLAYGTLNNEFKYALGYQHIYNKNPRRSSGVQYEYETQQLAQSELSNVENNAITSFLRRNPNNKLNPVREFKAYYEHEWYQGFSNTVTVKHKIIYPSDSIAFNKNNIPSLSNITASEISLYTRFAKDEKFLMGEFERVSLGTKSPILN